MRVRGEECILTFRGRARCRHLLELINWYAECEGEDFADYLSVSVCVCQPDVGGSRNAVAYVFILHIEYKAALRRDGT